MMPPEPEEDGCGGGGRTEERAWGTFATSVPEPGTCIQECKRQFLEGVAPGGGGGGEPSIDACRELSGVDAGRGDERFWSLYCCDSVNCGVRIDPKGLSQDREWFCCPWCLSLALSHRLSIYPIHVLTGSVANVNGIINKCQE